MTRRPGVEGHYDRPFQRWAHWLLERGVHPNHLTFLQLPVFVLQIVAAVQGWRLPFAFSTLLIILLDGGDGILARVGRLESKAGAVLDATFDTLGIAIVMWGATRFYPEQAPWLMFLFLGNIVLFLQNALLGDKVIAYLRGPVAIAVAWPETLAGGLILPTVIIAVLLAIRTPATLRALAQKAP
ncbi:MAG TPA: CDP-alcohol phosphatidyltransferase family protein, partial [Candidatus Thermoplasmatota archaeon]|nr:CDP-alcohol phosphatidyltransferase family protein [Candidatus Thermoplasmatota archaeon]